VQVKASEIKPGMTLFLQEMQDKNRLVHSITPSGDGQIDIRFGAPTGDPEKHPDHPSEDLVITVDAGRQVDVIADEQGRRIATPGHAV